MDLSFQSFAKMPRLMTATADRGKLNAPMFQVLTLQQLNCDGRCDRSAAKEGDAWRGGDATEEWKETYLYGGGKAPYKGLRKRKPSSRGSPVMANGSMMKGVLGEGPEVEY